MNPAARWKLDFTLLSAIWGASFLFMRIGAAEFGPLPAAFVRVALAALCLLPLLILQQHWQGLLTHWRRLLFLGLITSALPFALFAYAVLSITTGLAAMLNATTPLLGALIAWAWLGERLGTTRCIGLAVGFAGVAALSLYGPGGISFKPGGSGWAVLACLGATLSYGLSASYTKRYLSGLPPMLIAAGSLLGAALWLALPAWWSWPPIAPGALAWSAMTAVALLCTGLAYVLYFRLVQRAGAARGLAVTFLVPVFALLYGALFIHEPITAAMLACGMVIVLGTALATGLLKIPA
jgi:drug/metabolite transporter (DMT)-like permease